MISPADAGEWTYYVRDHLGSTRVVIDDQCTVKEYYTYFPFGLEIDGWCSIAGDGKARFKFTGKELDDEDGLGWYYFGARYYNPEVGIWLTPDQAAGKYPSLSPYSYAANNPLKFIDPDGREIINLNGWVLGNPNVEIALQRLDAQVASLLGIKSEEFKIVISGGDRYIKDGGIFSATTHERIDSHPKSSHLISRGARGVDLRIPESPVTKEIIKKALKNIGIEQVKDDYINKPHIHFGLPWDQGADSETYKEGYIPFEDRTDINNTKKEEEDDENKKDL